MKIIIIPRYNFRAVLKRVIRAQIPQYCYNYSYVSYDNDDWK